MVSLGVRYLGSGLQSDIFRSMWGRFSQLFVGISAFVAKLNPVLRKDYSGVEKSKHGK